MLIPAMPFLHLLLILCLVSLGSGVAIKGPSGGVQPTGERPFRLNFHDLRRSDAAFDLFILSLQQFQQQNQTALLSYFLVAGIHGRPYASWDGVDGPYSAGYCTHSSILFPMWHRPYLALVEQIIWSNAQDIASRYPAPQRDRYKEAAVTLRLPYWDWAAKIAVPDELNAQQLPINTPTGPRILDNPLYNYTFHPQPSALQFPPTSSLSRYHSTVRYPDANGNSQPDRVNLQLQANADTIRDMTYQLVASQTDYAPFSNTGYTDARGNRYNSIENIHDAIHSLVGNGGHMSVIPFAAFDPIFWLHHANVDRIIAMWQAIYPDSFVVPEIDQAGTYTIAPGTIEDVDTPLTPFHSDDQGTLYTSATARSIGTFGYTYPEIIDWNVSTSELSSNVRRNFNQLYNPSGGLSSRSLRVSRSSDSTSSSSSYQHSINIRVDGSALDASFFIHFYLGDPPSDPGAWSYATNLIGSHSVLQTRSSSSEADNNITVYGQVPLTHALQKQIRTVQSFQDKYNTSSARTKTNHSIPINAQSHESKSLSPTSLTAFLREYLTWRIQLFNDEPVYLSSSNTIDSLRIFVVAREVIEEAYSNGEEDRLPKYGPFEVVKGVTCGKLGGLKETEGG